MGGQIMGTKGERYDLDVTNRTTRRPPAPVLAAGLIWPQLHEYLGIRHSLTNALESSQMMAGHYTRDNLAAVLREHDINPTHQRIEIAYALFSRGVHLSADQLLGIVNGRHSETSK